MLSRFVSKKSLAKRLDRSDNCDRIKENRESVSLSNGPLTNKEVFMVSFKWGLKTMLVAGVCLATFSAGAYLCIPTPICSVYENIFPDFWLMEESIITGAGQMSMAQDEEDYTNAIVMVSIYPTGKQPHVDVYWKSLDGKYVGGQNSADDPKYSIRIYIN